ncbi:hypothetical protein CR194_01235 [Salipaludibacillus keqinensis]|uniref:STAS domain-containing protein n=1 Tax=Salipaludibacillus keqinensis TaxID=2045207 RepID=A0A323TI32_9BACI|nr:STAS domain-containing protein [Salipaludibacillus keqinensis]PYZ94190.1 hypothetical protein CR194_01235 [Salipaludibacillus keqinensis]
MTRSMKEISKTIVNYVVDNEEELVNKVMRHDEMSHHHDTHDLREIFFRFIQRFQAHLVSDSMIEHKNMPLIDSDTDRAELAQSVSVTAIIDGLYEMSKTIWTMFQQEVQDRFNLTSDELLHVHDLLNKEIKQGIKEVLSAHVEATNRREDQFHEKLDEISVPIINITEKTAICPIIGKIDERRGQHLMNHTLHQCRDRKITQLIFDMSGVPTIDNIVASYLNSVIQSLALIGVNITLTGVRSNIALTVIQQEIHFDKVNITSNVQQALQKAGIISSQQI